jgi:hypothetical protein
MGAAPEIVPLGGGREPTGLSPGLSQRSNTIVTPWHNDYTGRKWVTFNRNQR